MLKKYTPEAELAEPAIWKNLRPQVISYGLKRPFHLLFCSVLFKYCSVLFSATYKQNRTEKNRQQMKRPKRELVPVMKAS